MTMTTRTMTTFLIMAATQASAQPLPTSADCDLAPSYVELTTRDVTSVYNYLKLETDFIALNGKHVSRKMRLPPSISFPVTADNFVSKAADLQRVARTRVDMMACK